MAFDFAALKGQVRQIVHNTMGVRAEYTHFDSNGAVELRIRWHNKIARTGELLDLGYAEVIEGVNRVILNIPELNQKSVIVQRGGQLKLLDPQFNGAVLILDAKEPQVGPIEEIWLIRHDI